MTKEADAQVASATTSLEDIAKQLTKSNCSCVRIIIVEDKKPVGKKLVTLHVLHHW